MNRRTRFFGRHAKPIYWGAYPGNREGNHFTRRHGIQLATLKEVK